MTIENSIDDMQLILPKFEELINEGDQKNIDVNKNGLNIEAEIEELLKQGTYEDALSLIEMNTYFRDLLMKLRLKK